MEKIEQQEIYKILKENATLKRKIAYSLGSLETVNYLIKDENPQNVEHVRVIVDRVLDELKKEEY